MCEFYSIKTASSYKPYIPEVKKTNPGHVHAAKCNQSSLGNVVEFKRKVSNELCLIKKQRIECLS